MGDETTPTDGAWYPDPTGRHQQRFWDGTAWTDRVNDAGVPGSDPLGAGPPTAAPAPSEGADADLLGATTVVVELPLPGRGATEASLQVRAEDQRPLGWVRYVRGANSMFSGRVHRSAELYDIASQPVVAVRCEQQTTADASPGPGHRDRISYDFKVVDPAGTILAQKWEWSRYGLTKVSLADGHGTAVMALAFGGRDNRQAPPTTVTMGGQPVAYLTPLGQRVAGAPGAAWARLDRSALPAGLPTLLALAAPLLMVTYLV